MLRAQLICSTAKDKATGRHVPIVAVDGARHEGDEETCRQAGMDGYIRSPFSSRDSSKSSRR
jgi:CheY-like chemotaxis protein